MLVKAGLDCEFTNQERAFLTWLVLFGSDRCNIRESQTNTVPFGPARVTVLSGIGFLESRGHFLDSGQKRTAPLSSVTSSTHNRNEYTPVDSISSKSRWMGPHDQGDERLDTGGATIKAGAEILGFNKGKAIFFFASPTIECK